MQQQKVKVNEVIERLESIQQEVNHLLVQLRPLMKELHQGEDRMIDFVMGEQLDQSNVAGPSDQRVRGED